MNKLLPSGAYFKSTTRRILDQREKREMIEASRRASAYLVSRLNTTPEPQDLSAKLTCFKYRSKILGRLVILVKGSTQPKRLYRRERRCAIAREAWRIANETGADYELVRQMFMASMSSFVSEDS